MPMRLYTSILLFAGLLLKGLFALIVVLGALAIPAGLILLGLTHGRRGAQWLWSRLAPPPEPELGS